MKRTKQNSQRGLIEVTEEPLKPFLRDHDRFSYYDGSIRITFKGRTRGNQRVQSWQGYLSHEGKTYGAYAGTSNTFDLAKARRKLLAKAGLT